MDQSQLTRGAITIFIVLVASSFIDSEIWEKIHHLVEEINRDPGRFIILGELAVVAMVIIHFGHKLITEIFFRMGPQKSGNHPGIFSHMREEHWYVISILSSMLIYTFCMTITGWDQHTQSIPSQEFQKSHAEHQEPVTVKGMSKDVTYANSISEVK